MRMTKLITTGFILGACLTVTTTASAGFVKSNTITTTIKKADLNTQADIVRTYNKLSEIALESCESSSQATLQEKVFQRRCAVRLLDDFVENTDHAGLTQYHQTRISA